MIHLAALPHFESYKISERINRKVYDSQEQTDNLNRDILDMLAPVRRWSIWVEEKDKTDLILFRYEGMWRLFLRTKITYPQMEKSRELSLVVGLDL